MIQEASRRISRKKKAALRRHSPFGVVDDRTALPGIRGVRKSFVDELGHSKSVWAHAWAIYNPGASGVGRFVVTAAWFSGQEHRIPKGLKP